VSFSARSAPGIGLIALLRAHGVDARGHDQATGGNVTKAGWTDLLMRLGLFHGYWAGGFGLTAAFLSRRFVAV
jgi:hypothetical protein